MSRAVSQRSMSRIDSLEALVREGAWSRARAGLVRESRRSPRDARVAMLLARCCAHDGDTAAASHHAERAVVLAGASAASRMNLADVRMTAEDVEGAIPVYRDLVAEHPASVVHWGAYIHALSKARRFVFLAELWERLSDEIKHEPRIRYAFVQTWRELGRADRAIDELLSLIGTGLDDAKLWSLVIPVSAYTDTVDRARTREFLDAFAQSVRARYRPERWAERELSPAWSDRDPERRLRVGFVTYDLRRHSSGLFHAPLVDHVDVDRYDVEMIHTGPVDEVTERYRGRTARLVCVHPRTTDVELRDLLRRKRFDVVVECMGHSYGHRMWALADRVAPVQVSWLGWPNSTGFPGMDFRVVSDRTEPAGCDVVSSEKRIRVPGVYSVYVPLHELPEVSALPAPEKGHVTFGSFNSPKKFTRTTLRLWARVLERVEGSRLMLMYNGLGDPKNRAWLEELLDRGGIDHGRVDVRPGVASSREMMPMYRMVDIGLDPHPYNGNTTTFESVLMGVPVVTLAGYSAVSRTGLAIMETLGHGEFVAANQDQYVEIAGRWAQDLEGLAGVRAGLRERVLRTEELRPEVWSANFYEGLRGAWRMWCSGEHTID